MNLSRLVVSQKQTSVHLSQCSEMCSISGKNGMVNRLSPRPPYALLPMDGHPQIGPGWPRMDQDG
jgi:hypothetical protein